MHFLDHTCGTPEQNLALDEALLERAESAGRPAEILRLWEPVAPLVVVGHSSHVAAEVDEAACRARGVTILRRISGGAAIVTGRGCLMYGVVLSYELRPDLRALDVAHQRVLETLAGAIEPLVRGVRYDGTCDLTFEGRKFSGNAVRCRRTHMLYHGTILYDFPLELIGACLRVPPRQPEYRAGRSHGEFVTNLPTTSAALNERLREAWRADTPLADNMSDLVARFVAEKYARAQWNFKR